MFIPDLTNSYGSFDIDGGILFSDCSIADLESEPGLFLSNKEVKRRYSSFCVFIYTVT